VSQDPRRENRPAVDLGNQIGMAGRWSTVEGIEPMEHGILEPRVRKFDFSKDPGLLNEASGLETLSPET
jgi:hypothetical protein